MVHWTKACPAHVPPMRIIGIECFSNRLKVTRLNIHHSRDENVVEVPVSSLITRWQVHIACKVQKCENHHLQQQRMTSHKISRCSISRILQNQMIGYTKTKTQTEVFAFTCNVITLWKVFKYLCLLFHVRCRFECQDITQTQICRGHHVHSQYKYKYTHKQASFSSRFSPPPPSSSSWSNCMLPLHLELVTTSFSQQQMFRVLHTSSTSVLLKRPKARPLHSLTASSFPMLDWPMNSQSSCQNWLLTIFIIQPRMFFPLMWWGRNRGSKLGNTCMSKPQAQNSFDVTSHGILLPKSHTVQLKGWHTIPLFLYYMDGLYHVCHLPESTLTTLNMTFHLSDGCMEHFSARQFSDNKHPTQSSWPSKLQMPAMHHTSTPVHHNQSHVYGDHHHHHRCHHMLLHKIPLGSHHSNNNWWVDIFRPWKKHISPIYWQGFVFWRSTEEILVLGLLVVNHLRQNMAITRGNIWTNAGQHFSAIFF